MFVLASCGHKFRSRHKCIHFNVQTSVGINVCSPRTRIHKRRTFAVALPSFHGLCVCRYEEEIDELERKGRLAILKDETSGRVCYLVGTLHTSPESAEELSKVIRSVKPDVVTVQLCPSRVSLLEDIEVPWTEQARQVLGDMPRWRWMRPFRGVEIDEVFGLEVLADAQRRQHLAVDSCGLDYVTAAAESARVGAKLLLADRPYEVTILRRVAAQVAGSLSTPSTTGGLVLAYTGALLETLEQVLLYFVAVVSCLCCLQLRLAASLLLPALIILAYRQHLRTSALSRYRRLRDRLTTAAFRSPKVPAPNQPFAPSSLFLSDMDALPASRHVEANALGVAAAAAAASSAVVAVTVRDGCVAYPDVIDRETEAFAAWFLRHSPDLQHATSLVSQVSLKHIPGIVQQWNQHHHHNPSHSHPDHDRDPDGVGAGRADALGVSLLSVPTPHPLLRESAERLFADSPAYLARLRSGLCIDGSLVYDWWTHRRASCEERVREAQCRGYEAMLASCVRHAMGDLTLYAIEDDDATLYFHRCSDFGYTYFALNLHFTPEAAQEELSSLLAACEDGAGDEADVEALGVCSVSLGEVAMMAWGQRDNPRVRFVLHPLAEQLENARATGGFDEDAHRRAVAGDPLALPLFYVEHSELGWVRVREKAIQPASVAALFVRMQDAQAAASEVFVEWLDDLGTVQVVLLGDVLAYLHDMIDADEHVDLKVVGPPSTAHTADTDDAL